jgi:hypothetical protein
MTAQHTQHTYTEACDGHHEGPCPIPPVTQRHLIPTPISTLVDQLSEADLERLADRLSLRIEQRIRRAARARGGWP